MPARPEAALAEIDAVALERWMRARRPAPPPALVARRLAMERRKGERLAAVAASALRRLGTPHYVLPRAIALSGLGGAVRRNALRIGTTRRVLALPALPAALEGFRILHVSDPHFGADPGLDDAIVASVAGLAHELCVLTGDYRYRSFGELDTALAGMARLGAVLAAGGAGRAPLAVLGNHDSIEMAPPLEALGIRVLLNERVTLRHGGAALRVAGIDDPRYYRLDDLDRALAGDAADGDGGTDGREAPDGADRRIATVLLAHSPERAEEAAAAGCDAYLCGHTHGGQLCLPGGRIVTRNARAPRGRLSGAWRLGAMRGYTSRGAGVSIATARFACPPEITLHELRRAAD